MMFEVTYIDVYQLLVNNESLIYVNHYLQGVIGC